MPCRVFQHQCQLGFSIECQLLSLVDTRTALQVSVHILLVLEAMLRKSY